MRIYDHLKGTTQISKQKSNYPEKMVVSIKKLILLEKVEYHEFK